MKIEQINQQPEALRLADLIDMSWPQPGSVQGAAATELRCLHAENVDLRAENERLRARVKELGEQPAEPVKVSSDELAH